TKSPSTASSLFSFSRPISSKEWCCVPSTPPSSGSIQPERNTLNLLISPEPRALGPGTSTTLLN
ncbi:hypothetical protein H4R33_006871, partial [Dimargaris cristalligena]